ncbi:MAG: hypothetical protein FJ390_03410 [Verrucomicrobia bacterium]|nr:hypothetical protein [Verrucomicrobiota bacterium]
MKKIKSFLTIFGGIFFLLFLSACATGPTVDPQVTSAVSADGVSGVTYEKMLRGGVLDYNDIAQLVQHKVPSNIIVGYLRNTERVYNFSYEQLQQLRHLGATPQVLNYLTETQGFYGNNTTPSRGSKVPKYIRDNSMLNQDKQPFFYNEPIVDDWYDSAYEESCYSPFSFN